MHHDTGEAARQAEALLARFPGPVTLTPSRLKLFVGLALMLGLLVFCVLVLIPKLPDAGGYDVIMTVLSTLVIGVLTVRTAILLVVPGTIGLTLDADGFAIGGFFRRARTRWRDAGGFRVEVDEDKFRRIAYEFADGSRRGAKVTRLLAENYALPWDDFAWLMNTWRERALAQPHQPWSVPHIAPRT